MALVAGSDFNAQGKQAVDNINQLSNKAQQQYQAAIGQNQQALDTLKLGDPSKTTETMRGYAGKISDIAGGMGQYSSQMSGIAGDMTASAKALTDQGKALGVVGNDILNMNRDSSSEYVRSLLGLYDQYDPENKVSFAAQDVQDSFATGQGQLLRDMSRTGVNVSSGRSNALKQQYQIALNTALAAAKTRARTTGLQEQTAAFKSLVEGGATSVLNQSRDWLVSGVGANANAVNALNNAASVDSTAGGLFVSAASIEQNAANLEMGYYAQLASQQNTVANAQRSLGSLQDSQASRETNFLNSQLNNRWTTSVDFTDGTASGDPWAATGHTSTYWKNKLSGADYADMAQNIGISANIGNGKK